MPERLKKRAMRVVGVRQVLRAVKEDRAQEVFLAMDADSRLRAQIEQEVREKGLPLHMISTMEELAALCRVDVPSAAAGLLRGMKADGRAAEE